MKGKEFLTEAISVNMPDLEAVRAQCLNQTLTDAVHDLYPTENERPRRKFDVKKLFVSLIAAVLMLCMSFTVLGATVPGVNRIIRQFSPELADFLGQHFTEDMLSNLPKIEGEACLSDGFELTLVSAISANDKVMAIIVVRDLEQRNLFETGSFFTFAVKADNGNRVDEGYVDYNTPNTGVIRIFLNDFDPAKASINLELYNFEHSKGQTYDITGDEGLNLPAGDALDRVSLSGGVWTFNFSPVIQETKTIRCEVAAFGTDDVDGPKHDVVITEVTVAPFYVSLVATGNIWCSNNIYLILDDGRGAWLTWDGGVLTEYKQADGSWVASVGDDKVVRGDIEVASGYCRVRDDGLYEHEQHISSTTEVNPETHQSYAALIDITRVVAIVINGERIDF